MNLNKLLIYSASIYFFYAPFSVSDFCEVLITTKVSTSIIIEIFMNILFICLLAFNKNSLFDKKGNNFIIAYFVPIILSILIIPINLWIIDSDNYQNGYLATEFILRSFHLISSFNIFILFMIFLNKVDKARFEIFLKAYLYGILVLCAFGIWQWGNFYMDIPYPDLETRSYVHSVGYEVDYSIIKGRITSLTAEPSYLAPFMIDGMIIAGILGYRIKKNIYLYFSMLFVLFFSYSLGGYIDFIFVCLMGLFIKTKVSIKNLIYLSAAIILIFIGLNFCQDYLLPVINRVSFDLLKASSRYYMWVMPFEWISEYGILNEFFGYGPGSFKSLAQTHILPNGGVVQGTSNNLFVDYFYECGIYGLCSMIIYFIFLIKLFYKNAKINDNVFYAFLLVIHLFSSSIYRGDFVSSRFFIIIIILIYADKFVNIKKNKYSR